MTALFAALFVGLATPATAATYAVLKAFSVSPASASAPGTVSVSYSAESADGLGYVMFHFRDSDGRGYAAQAHNPPLDGTVVLNLPDGVRNGSWTLYRVLLRTPNGYDTLYNRDGTIESGGTHTYDLSNGDITVSGSTEDTAAPVVRTVSVHPSAVKPLDKVTNAWTQDEVHTTKQVTAVFINPTFHHEISFYKTTTSHPYDPLVGTSFIAGVPTTAYNGEYVLDRLYVTDTFQNTATYRTDGTVVSNFNGTAPATHAMDFSKVTFTVAGSLRDTEPPTLKDFSVVDSTLTAGDTVSVDYVATEDQPPLDGVEFQFRASDGQLVWLGDTDSPALTARLSGRVFSVGTHELTKAVLADRVGNRVEYLRDGTVVQGANRSTHSFDFKAADLIVKPSAPSILLARPKPRAVELSWEQDSAQLPGISSYRVEANPGGRIVTLPVNRSGESPFQKYTVTGLSFGVQYTFSITAQSGVGAGPTAVTRAIPRMSDRIFGVGDVSSDGRADVIAFGPTVGTLGTVSAYLGSGRSGFSGKRTTMASEHVQRMAPGGDLYRDGDADYAFVNANNDLELHASNGRGAVSYRFRLGTGWGSMKFVDGGYDFSGDGCSDVLGVAKNGDLYLYKGSGTGRLTPGTRIGTGWGSMLAVMSTGDVDGDRFNDVVAVDSTGTMRLYKGNGKGGWRDTSTRIGPGWSGFGAVFPMRDFSGDGRVDIGAVTMTGDLYLYKGNGKGGFSSRAKIGHGWHTFF
ncbi:FG-GAP-like repeat-containing protein [Knoellia sp. p5-6-4]|uniref:FG-GAP-like repeat-containing protein n=1 Tax=unclassified Knoellia TaxID=2618719 RepID=UPI0023DA2023|nr:FG-GAP-like repeat-containing protein [Knoellia sp. p5-6-4]MDF2144681.1 FG-GAP-like repeat-containing protein [Knoellia sp. p5-6-4]